MASDEVSLFSSKARKKARKNANGNGRDEAALEPTDTGSHAVGQSFAWHTSQNDGAVANTGDNAAEAQPLNTREPAGHVGEEDFGEDASFRDLGLSEWLDRVCKSLGMARPTQVQRGCIPAILAGRDVIGTAHTGSGKTAAFALPILQLLARDCYGVYALVLTPTRELAFQLADQFRALGAGMTLNVSVIIGGLDMRKQAQELASRPHVVIATPGRLKELLGSNDELASGFGRAAFLVLDEADRLLEPSFEPELRGILAALPARRQTLLFSATMTRTLVALQTAVLRDAFHFQAYEGLQTAARLREEYLFIPAKVKEVYLAHLLADLAAGADTDPTTSGSAPSGSRVRSAIIFAGTCAGCRLLAALLQELGLPAAALHSHLPQRRRLAALDRFKSSRVPILLATDVASRGLDIPTVDLVINFDLPVAARDYVHRVGRTARAGREGWSLSLVTQYDTDLVGRIEELTGSKMQEHKLEEAAVLKGITKVFAARRAAALRIAEEDAAERGGGAGRVAAAKRGQKRRGEPAKAA